MKYKSDSEHLSVRELVAVVADLQRNVATKQDVLTLRAATQEGFAIIHATLNKQTAVPGGLDEHPLRVIELS